MSRPTRDGTAEPVSRDQILRHARGQGDINFPCSADHEQDWQPYPVDPYSAIFDDHTYIHTIINCLRYVLYQTSSPHINSGKREAHKNWSMVIPEKAAPVTKTKLRYWPCAGGLSAVCTYV